MTVLEKIRDFVRPVSVAAMVALLLLGALASGALEAAWPGMGIRFTGGVAGWFRAIPGDFYNLLMAGFGFYTVARSAQEIAKTMKTPPPPPDAPIGKDFA